MLWGIFKANMLYALPFLGKKSASINDSLTYSTRLSTCKALRIRYEKLVCRCRLFGLDRQTNPEKAEKFVTQDLRRSTNVFVEGRVSRYFSL